MCRTHKKFLDLLAISAGIKKPWPQRKKQQEFDQDHRSSGTITPARDRKKKAHPKDGTFLTGVGSQAPEAKAHRKRSVVKQD